jgi:hypothetical protein
LVLGAIALLPLAGCAVSQPGISPLSAPSDAQVQLPAHIHPPEAMGSNVVLLAEKGDYAFYAADEVSGGACVIVVNKEYESDWVGGCGGAPPWQFAGAALSPIVQIDGPVGVKTKLYLDGYDAADDLANGWELLHPNLLVTGL